MTGEDSKTCTRCGEAKPLDHFVRNRNRKGGYEGICKPCHRDRQKQYYAEAPDRIRTRMYAVRDPRKHIATNLKWSAANPEKVREYKRKWAKANPEAGREKLRRRRARLLNALVEAVDFDAILIRDEGVCGICGQPIMESTIELDHVVPLVAGGTHEPNNVQIAHRTCNRRKHAKADFSLRTD